MIEALTPKHGPDFEEMSPDLTKELHDAWAEMISAAPWNQIDDGHIIVHHHPTAGDTYSVVMGRLGEVRGISTYLGQHGFESLISLLTGGPLRAIGIDVQLETQNYFEEIDAIIAVSADREELSEEERRLIRQAGLRYRGRSNWAQIQRAIPGYLPYRTDANEGRFTKLIIQDVTDIADKIQQGRIDAENWVNFRNLLHSTFDGTGWVHEWRPMPDRPDPPDDVHVDMDQLKALPAGKEKWLVVEHMAGQSKAAQVSHRPFNAKIQMIRDLKVRKPKLMPNIEGPATRMSRQRHFTRTLMQEGQLPESLTVQDEPTFLALDPICDGLGIQILVSTQQRQTFP